MDALILAIVVMGGLALFLFGLLLGSVIEQRLTQGATATYRETYRENHNLPELPDFLR